LEQEATMVLTTARALTEDDPRWRAVAARDRRQDGAFVYAVRTTGVYCRPSCPARRAKPENVSFFAGPAQAALAGFRPCRRCAPDAEGLVETAAVRVAQACRTLEAAVDEAPSLAALAREAGLSVSRFHRLFRSITGVTPKAYADGLRAARLREVLGGRPGSVTEAIYEAGFGSSGRFYEAADRLLGMTPSQYRAGGAGAEIRYAVADCSLGSVLAAQSERGVCAILLGDAPEPLLAELRGRFPSAILSEAGEDFAAVTARVVALVERPSDGFDLPLDIRGTVFQQRVWAALAAVPAGETVSYAELARRTGAPQAVRAVAGACAANALAVAIPCHRVLRSDGGLSGYRWGTDRKRALLDRERG